MAAISPEMRKRLMSQLKGLDTRTVISNSTFEKGRYFIAPARSGELPGIPCVGIYSKALKDGVTSLRTFGLLCPIADYIDKVRQTGSKEEKDAQYQMASMDTEYWMVAIPYDDRGTASAPNFKILCTKKTVYEKIIRRMVDDDIGEDITAPAEARSIMLKKEQANNKTSWSIEILDKEPMGDDDYCAAVTEQAEAFDIRARFYRANREKIEKIYEMLTGESVPESYWEQDGIEDALASKRDDDSKTERPTRMVTTAKPAAKVAAKPAVKPAAKVVTKPAPKPAPAPAPAEDPQIVVGETQVSFVDGDGTVAVGTVVKVNEDDSYDVDVDGSVWGVPASDLTIVEPEATPAASDEPEETVEAPAEEPAPVARRTVVKTAPAKVAPKGTPVTVSDKARTALKAGKK